MLPTSAFDLDEHARLRRVDGGGADLVATLVTSDDHERTSDLLPSFRSPVTRDLVRIAKGVYAADRLTPRKLPHVRRGLATQFVWRRALEVELAVEVPEVWTALVGELTALLKFMSDDSWTLRFRGGAVVPAQQPGLFGRPLPSGSRVALFSGGLDSVAGLEVDRRGRASGSTGVVLPISIVGTNVRRNRMRAALQPVGGSRNWIGFDMRVKESEPKTEKSARTRAFAFFAVAAACAAELEADEVASYETGVGAINPPMNSAHVGARCTRAMHPQTIARMQRIVQAATRRSIRLVQPFFFHTKGELCLRVEDRLRDVAMASFSCDRTERAQPQDNLVHCGVCTSYVYRRVAIAHAIVDDPTPYEAPAADSAEYGVRAYEHQAVRFMNASSSWPELVRAEPTLVDVPEWIPSDGEPDELKQRLLDLFRRHARQVLDYFEGQRAALHAAPGR